jgi:transposase-like protein
MEQIREARISYAKRKLPKLDKKNIWTKQVRAIFKAMYMKSEISMK